MGTLRVTQGLMVQRALNNINRQTRSLLDLQEQLATGLRVNTPSDDPLAARRAIDIRASIDENEQYLTNISSTGPQLQETATTLQTVIDNLQRARELTLQGASGTYSQTQLDVIAVEVDQILEAVLAEGNHQTNGRFIFGGTRTLNASFVATHDTDGRITAVTYEGNDEFIEVGVGSGVSVNTNEPGNRAFQGTQDVFQMLIDIRDNLLAGDQSSLQGPRLEELSAAQDQLLLSMAGVGAIQNRLERLTVNMEDSVLQLQAALSDNIDADYAETVLNLNAQSNAFSAALNAAARVIQPTLLQFVQ
ncbi:MAG: flagellar hook-associated protein 3 [Nitrospiraceae bacterium]|nr:flagellar hook-associated protein 3 [Nitrospiraceae bacterium]